MAELERITSVRSVEDMRRLFGGLRARCRAMVQGRDDVIELVLIALLADGHVLLEDYPGSGKTTLAKALGDAIHRPDGGGKFEAVRRIQFTPDLLPSDITGVTMFDATRNEFQFRPGPIFANVVLADEINRTSPKVQASLLEAMAEKQVSVDNHTHRLEDVFFVLATQNPLDLMGTYPLPQAQLDRFLFKIKMAQLAREFQLEVLSRWRAARAAPPTFSVTPAALVEARKLTQDAVTLSPVIQELLVDLGEELRRDPRVLLGISTRALVNAMPALQVRALVEGRDFVTPADVKALAVPMFAHRLTLAPGTRAAESEPIVAQIAAAVVDAHARKAVPAVS